jgi:hypothetical protein
LCSHSVVSQMGPRTNLRNLVILASYIVVHYLETYAIVLYTTFKYLQQLRCYAQIPACVVQHEVSEIKPEGIFFFAVGNEFLSVQFWPVSINWNPILSCQDSRRVIRNVPM